MPPGSDQPSFLLTGQSLQTEAFRKFGLEVPNVEQLSDETSKIIQFLAGRCLPVIGEHCRSIGELYEAKVESESSGKSKISNPGDHEEHDEEYENLVSEQKRLLALRATERATATACQTSNELLNKGALILQKTAPLVAATNKYSSRLSSLKTIEMPKLKTSHGDVPSMEQIMSGMPVLDEVGKFSLHELVQNRIYDYSSVENILAFLQSGIPDLISRSGFSGNSLEDRKCTMTLVRLMALVKALKTTHKHLCGRDNQENLLRDTEDFFHSLQDQLKDKISKIAEIDTRNICESTSSLTLNGHQSMIDIREDLHQSINSLCSQLDENEAIEDQIRLKSRELYSSRKLLQTLDSFVNMVRYTRIGHRSGNLEQVIPTSKETISPHLSILQDAIPLDFESVDEKGLSGKYKNRDAIEYLTRLENSVDTSKLHTIQQSTCGPIVDELANELKTFKIMKAATDLSSLPFRIP